MSFKQMMTDDLDIFYDSDELGVSAKFNANPIVVLFLDDLEISNSEQTVISAKTSDVVGIKISDLITIETTEYKVINFDDKDKTKLEQLIALSKV